MAECCKPCRRLEHKVAIVYLDEERDAKDMAERIKCLGGECLLLQGDLKEPKFAKWCVEKTLCHFRAIDILVNNHAFQFIRRSILEISHEQLEFIFRNREDKLAKFDKESAKIVWISVENTNIIFL